MTKPSLQNSLAAAFLFSLLLACGEFIYNKQFASAVDEDVAAIVNDNTIKLVDYLTAATMIEEDKRGALNAADYQLVIDRLVEEELLFQHGLQQQIIFQADISKKIIDNMLANILSSISSEEINDSEIEAFYKQQMQTNPSFANAMKTESFDSIKKDLGLAMVEMRKSQAIRDYLAVLKDKAQIQYQVDSSIAQQTQAVRETL